MPPNRAAWIIKEKQSPVEVKSAPYTKPGANEIVIKNCAVAINPIDWIFMVTGTFAAPWIKFPYILGSDVAGEVFEVGSAVKRFRVGDRVVGHAIGVDKEYNSTAQAGFQEYTVLQQHMTSPIPSTMSYETASVIPLGASTAACGLFQKDQLNLQFPTVPPKPTEKTLLIWGGSTSVGCNAIQLAVAAGYEVITTCSPKNFPLVKSLGASKAFDYNSRTVVPDIIKAFEGKTSAGALSIGAGAADACMDILYKCQGNRFISMASYPVPDPAKDHSFLILKTIYGFVTWSIANWFKSKTRGTRTNFIFGTTLVQNGVSKAVYEDFLPEALAQGIFVPAPDTIVVGKGLEFIQPALDLQRQGVSAKKVVVSL